MFAFQTSLWSVGTFISNGEVGLTCGRWFSESQAESRRQLDISGQDAGGFGTYGRGKGISIYNDGFIDCAPNIAIHYPPRRAPFRPFTKALSYTFNTRRDSSHS